jgi:predicted dehydrogenase
MQIQPIGTALAAFGMSGQVFHGPLLSAHPGFEWLATLERNSEKSRQANPTGLIVRTFANLLQVSGLELLIINTPHALHFEMASQALMAGKHVVVEKPMGMSTFEVQQLYELAKKQNRVLTCFQNRRFDSDFLALTDVLDSGRIGEWKEAWLHFDRFRPKPNLQSWKEAEDAQSGNLLNLGPHLIDQAIVLFGKPDWVQADIRQSRNGAKSNDAFHIVLGYAEKRCNLVVSYHTPGNPLKYKIFGTQGAWEKYGADVQEEQLKVGMLPGEKGYGVEPMENRGVLTSADGKSVLPTPVGNYQKFYDEVFLSIRQGKSLNIRPEEIILQHMIIHAALLSNEKERRVYL